LKKVLVFIVLAVVIATAAIFAPTFYQAARPIVPRLLDLGEKYLLELNYEQAIMTFTKLIEIEPKSERAYLGLAEAYLENGEPKKAIVVLKDGLEQLPDSAAIKALLEKLAGPEPSPAIAPTEPPVKWKVMYAQFIQDLEYLYIGTRFPHLHLDYEELAGNDNELNVRSFHIHDIDANGIPELIVQKASMHYSTSDVYTIVNDSIQYIGACGYPPLISSDSNFPGVFSTNEDLGSTYLDYNFIQNGVVFFLSVYAEDIENEYYETSNSALLEASKSIEPLKRFIGREAIMEELGATLVKNSPETYIPIKYPVSSFDYVDDVEGEVKKIDAAYNEALDIMNSSVGTEIPNTDSYDPSIKHLYFKNGEPVMFTYFVKSTLAKSIDYLLLGNGGKELLFVYSEYSLPNSPLLITRMYFKNNSPFRLIDGYGSIHDNAYTHEDFIKYNNAFKIAAQKCIDDFLERKTYLMGRYFDFLAGNSN
jgi:tetratricopeptide (TPR) repeat protein